MTTIYQFPTDWWRFAQRKFALVSISQTTGMPLLGTRRAARGVAQLWRGDFTLVSQKDPARQEIEAFWHRLDGQAGVVRMGDPSRRKPWYNRNLSATTATFSDGFGFSDGTGFADGYLPPFVNMYAAATKGASFIQLAGFPASIAAALTRGDLLEIRPAGIAAEHPHLYEVMHGNASDASGRAGVEIRPRLRAGVAAGDQVVLSDPTSVFHLSDDNQAEMDVDRALHGELSFSLVEALDLVP